MSAKALGAMVKGTGESCFQDLLPWLMDTLASDFSSVDRSGAAQGKRGGIEIVLFECYVGKINMFPFAFPTGLSEVMAGLGVEKLEKLMPEIVATASKPDIASHVRDGYIMMFIYLPITFGDKFTPYVGPCIPCILKVTYLFEYYIILCGIKFIIAFSFKNLTGLLHYIFDSTVPSLAVGFFLLSSLFLIMLKRFAISI